MDRAILHCDLNNFYASVEIMLNPDLRGKPVAVCGDPKKRHGIILAKSVLAKASGVSTGEAIWEAKQKCPDLILVAPHFEEYVKISDKVRSIYKEYTDRVESFGIDECWLDVTESQKLLGDATKIANTIRNRIREEIGITISVGVSFTKVLAKLGSDYKKPDATTVITRQNFKQIVWPLSVSEMLMIGRSTQKKLNSFNIKTIGDLAVADKNMLRAHFGVIADRMLENANGIENEQVSLVTDTRKPKSVGHGTTTKRDIKNLDEAKLVIYALSEMVATRLRRYGLLAEGVSIGLRDSELSGFTRQAQLPYPTSNAEVIAEGAIKLTTEFYDFKIPLRTISVYTHKLSSGDEAMQLSLFDGENEKEDELSKSLDKIRDKYGYHIVQRAILLNNDLLGNDLHDDDNFLPFKKG